MWHFRSVGRNKVPDESAWRAFALVSLGVSMCPSMSSSQLCPHNLRAVPKIEGTFPESTQLA